MFKIFTIPAAINNKNRKSFRCIDIFMYQKGYDNLVS